MKIKGRNLRHESNRAKRQKYTRIPIIRTLANSNQNRFPLDFRHTFTMNLLLTRSNIHFPSGHFLYNFTLHNSNHVCQYVTSQNKQCTVVQNIKFILKQPCELSLFFYITQNVSVQFSSVQVPLVFTKCCILLNSFFQNANKSFGSLES